MRLETTPSENCPSSRAEIANDDALGSSLDREVLAGDVLLVEEEIAWISTADDVRSYVVEVQRRAPTAAFDDPNPRPMRRDLCGERRSPEADFTRGDARRSEVDVEGDRQLDIAETKAVRRTHDAWLARAERNTANGAHATSVAIDHDPVRALALDADTRRAYVS